MHLVLFPKTFNLAVGVGIGVAIAAVGRWLVIRPDNAEIMPVIGTLAVLGGVWVAASCAFRITRPAPSFAADEEGFSVMGKRKRPWAHFQGVGVHSLKQSGITTSNWVVVRVGKTPTFARKRHIRWTHMSDSAAVMAGKIHVYAQQQKMLSHLKETVDVPAPQAAPDAVGTVTSKVAAKAAPVEAGFSDGPIKTQKGFGARFFGG